MGPNLQQVHEILSFEAGQQIYSSRSTKCGATSTLVLEALLMRDGVHVELEAGFQNILINDDTRFLSKRLKVKSILLCDYEH